MSTRTVATITVHIDATLSFYTGDKHVVELDAKRLEQPVTVGSVLQALGVPYGMVGYIVRGGKLLTKDDTLEPPCELKLFGIYSGG
jgi:hypothetical protein